MTTERVLSPDDRETMNKAFRVFLQGIEEVLGLHGLAIVLREAKLAQYIDNYPPATMEWGGHKARYITQVARAIFDVYGARGSRAIMQRVGRAQAKSGIAENAMLVSATRLAMKLVPRRQQVRLVVEMAARAINEQIGDEVHISEDKDCIYYDAHQCCYCIDWRGESAPVCYAAVGFLHGLLAAMIEGEACQVEETLCRARGDSMCRYRIRLNPVGG